MNDLMALAIIVSVGLCFGVLWWMAESRPYRIDDEDVDITTNLIHFKEGKRP